MQLVELTLTMTLNIFFFCVLSFAHCVDDQKERKFCEILCEICGRDVNLHVTLIYCIFFFSSCITRMIFTVLTNETPLRWFFVPRVLNERISKNNINSIADVWIVWRGGSLEFLMKKKSARWTVACAEYLKKKSFMRQHMCSDMDLK